MARRLQPLGVMSGLALSVNSFRPGQHRKEKPGWESVRPSLSSYPALDLWGVPSGWEAPHPHHRTPGPLETLPSLPFQILHPVQPLILLLPENI